MRIQTARLIVLVTSMLAFTSVVVTGVVGLRLHRAREALVQLKHDGSCASRPRSGATPRE